MSKIQQIQVTIISHYQPKVNPSPEVTQSQPKATKVNPKSTQSQPKLTQSQPKPTQSNPKFTQCHLCLPKKVGKSVESFI